MQKEVGSQGAGNHGVSAHCEDMLTAQIRPEIANDTETHQRGVFFQKEGGSGG